MKRVATNTAHLDSTLLVEEHMNALGVVHAYTGRDLEPPSVRFALSKLAEQIVNDLTADVLLARKGCEALEAIVLRQRRQIMDLKESNHELFADAESQAAWARHYQQQAELGERTINRLEDHIARQGAAQ